MRKLGINDNLVGKIVQGTANDYNSFYISFTDGTYIGTAAVYVAYEDDIMIEDADPLELHQDEVVNLGFMSQAEYEVAYEAEMTKNTLAFQASQREQELATLASLKAKYE